MTSGWRASPLTKALGLAVPIVLAPMAGGPSTPALAAAVSDAGGLGMLGVGYLAPGAIGEELAAVRRLTDRPFGVNLFVARPVRVDRAEVEAAWALLAPYRAELDMVDTAAPTTYAEPYHDQVDAVVASAPALVTFTFGLPEPAMTDALHRAGSLVGVTVTTPAEAAAAAAAGVDLVCAQGTEAGGHRGTFLGDPLDALVGLAALVPQAAAAGGLPVLAAGGLMDGRGVAAALALGAAGAQLGTAFLCCPEAGTSAPYRQAIEASDGTTVLTRAPSGGWARGLPNRLTDELAQASLPPYPVMNALTRELRRRAAELGRPEFLSLWAGQQVAATRPQPASQLVQRLVAETDAVVERWRP